MIFTILFILSTENIKITKKVLPNGLRVLFVEDHKGSTNKFLNFTIE